MIKWNNVSLNSTVLFATKTISKDEFLSQLSGTTEYTQVRRLIRENGAGYARRVARKALKRRGILA